MASKTKYLIDKGLLKSHPKFLATGVQYEVIMGSVAYGVSEDHSDTDVYGFAIPPRDDVFPHLRGEIIGFDEPIPPFQQIQQHHMMDVSARGGKGQEYDLTIYSIVKYFRMLMENNPNIIDSLYVPRRCVLYSTAIGERVREHRQLFLHKGCWPKFKGYAYTQMHKMRTKVPEGKRQDIVATHGLDVKFAYHVVRLLNEVEQILMEQDLDLTRHREQLKAIRRGEWSMERIEQTFYEKEKQLEEAFHKSELPATPNKAQIKTLLLESLEQHYGSLKDCVVNLDDAAITLKKISELIDTYERKQPLE